MTATILRADGIIENPIGKPVLFGSLMTSDSMTRAAGAALNTNTQADLGGSAVAWTGSNAYEYDGTAITRSSNNLATTSPLILNTAQVKNCAVDFTIEQMSLSAYSYLAARVISGNNNYYWLRFDASVVRLFGKYGTSSVTDLGGFSAAAGDKIQFLLKENTISIYKNDVLVLNVVDTATSYEARQHAGRFALIKADTTANAVGTGIRLSNMRFYNLD